MLKKKLFILSLFVIFFSFAGRVEASKVSILNFATLNMEASGLGTEVTNLLADTLNDNNSISLLDRKDLETFLSLNDLQQNDRMDNVIKIGTRLGMDFIIVGNVEKRGSSIITNCKVIKIDTRQIVYNGRAMAMSETALKKEIAKLGQLIINEVNKVVNRGNEHLMAPCPPDLQIISGAKKITLRWHKIPDLATSVYEIYRALDKEGLYALIGQTDTQEYTDDNVDSGTNYYYKVRGIDRSGSASKFTEVMSASTDFPPNPPVIIKTEGRAKSIYIIWVPSPAKSGDKSELAGYKIYRSKKEEASYKQLINIKSVDLKYTRYGKIFYQDKEVADNETFYYKIIAFNEKGIESDFCHPIKGTSLPILPSINATSNLIREVKLAWSNNKSDSVSAFNIYRSTNVNDDFLKIKKISSSDADGDNFSYSDEDGLGDKIKYFYRIAIVDDRDEETSPSPFVSATTRDIPPQNQNLKAIGGLVKKVELTWNAATEEEIEGYNLYCSTEKDSKYVLLKNISGRDKVGYIAEYCSNEIFGAKLADNTNYHYRLTTYNKKSVESLPGLAFAKTKSRPQKTAGIKAVSLKPREVPITWKENPEKDIKLYHIYRSLADKDGFAEIGTTDKTAYLDTGLENGVKYSYKIIAECMGGLLSDSSDIISASTKPIPNPPVSLKGIYKNGKVEITWAKNKESDISHYDIYEKKFFSKEKIADTKATFYTDNNIDKRSEKKYVIKAIDLDGLESEFSDELSVSSK